MPAILMQARAMPSLARGSSQRSAATPSRPVLPMGRPSARLVIARAAGGTPGGSPPDPTAFIRGTAGTGGPGGAGGAGGNRPVGTGGPGDGGVPNLPAGWTWPKVLLTALGILLAVPVWNYIKDNYLNKIRAEDHAMSVAIMGPSIKEPEPEHTIVVTEGKGSDKKKGAVSKAASAVKHATVDPIKDTVAAIKHSDTGRAVQHKVEDTKDTVDINLTDLSNKADRAVAKGKQDVKHAVDQASLKVGDVKANVDSKAHEVSVKGGRTVQRGQEKVSDATYEAEKSVEKGTKSFFENMKGAATSVGRKLHVVADATEKGIKSAAEKGERATGVKSATTEDNKNAYYVGAGVVLGTAVLLYVWDRKGGDISGKVKRLRDKTQEATDTAMSKARDVLKGGPIEPAGPTKAP